MSRRFGFRRNRNARDADTLAPPEENVAAEKGGSAEGSGVHISADLMDEANNGSVFHLEPVVIVILLGALAFIAFIAWQLHNMPWPKD